MDWKKHFSQQILERGQNYYELDAVEIINASGDHIDANVRGNDFYNLRITFKDNQITSMYCDCPYEGNCKHLAATLYYADNHPEILNHNHNVENILNGVCEDDLRKFLLQEFSNDANLFNRFKVFINSEVDDDFYINKLKMSFSNSVNVIKFIDDDMDSLIEHKQFDLVFTLCDLLIIYLEELYDKDDWYSFDYILDKLDTIAIRIFNLGEEKKTLDFLANIILNNDNLDILDMLTDTYSRIGDVEKLFENHYGGIE